MVNIEIYKNNGWGLSKKCFEDILYYLDNNLSKKANIVEFGSGISSKFFVDLIGEGYDLNIISYDDDEKFAILAERKRFICKDHKEFFKITLELTENI